MAYIFSLTYPTALHTSIFIHKSTGTTNGYNKTKNTERNMISTVFSKVHRMHNQCYILNTCTKNKPDSRCEKKKGRKLHDLLPPFNPLNWNQPTEFIHRAESVSFASLTYFFSTCYLWKMSPNTNSLSEKSALQNIQLSSVKIHRISHIKNHNNPGLCHFFGIVQLLQQQPCSAQTDNETTSHAFKLR